VTGYILYSREVRKRVVQNNPDSNFGEISKIVGNEWRSLGPSDKQAWEEKASKLNEETKALLVNEECASPAPIPVDQVYECLWDGCDFQFEEISDCIEHCVKDKDGQGHVQSYFQANPDSEMNCQWRNCVRNNKKNIQPFPNLSRLIRHVRDMHINKGNGRSVPAADRSKNFKSSSKPATVARPTPSATPNPPASSTFNSTTSNCSTSPSPSAAAPTAPVVVQKPQEPMFISVPPRPQRVLHSEAYIKYIEGLHSENRFITPWEKTLNATRENITIPDPEKLNSVATWLGRKFEQQDDVVNALWDMRNQLLKDSLGIYKTF